MKFPEGRMFTFDLVIEFYDEDEKDWLEVSLSWFIGERGCLCLNSLVALGKLVCPATPSFGRCRIILGTC